AAILGQDPRQPAVIERAMDLALPGHLYAKAPVDMAVLDIAGQAAGVPVSHLLGGVFPGGVPIASSVSSSTPEEMLAIIESYRDRGYRAHSAKVGGDTGRDIERIRFLEAQRRPGELIFYDVNRAWSRQQALSVMGALADPVLIEQPCESLEDCKAVRRLTRHPISIDERLETLSDMTRIAAEGIGEVVNIKLNRVGGLSKAARLRDLALAHGIEIIVMPTGGTVLADTEAAHLAQSVPPEMRRCGWSCQDMITVDPAPGQGARNVSGTLTAPSVPGLGVAPELEWLGDPVAEFGG
ncbi:MAG: enolase C-terminal domain-like protein, partial [Pseudomonadota bacterium]